MKPENMYVWLLSGCLLLIGCIQPAASQPPGSPASNHTPAARSTPAETAETITLTGTVVFVNLEGGFFAIRDDDGQAYTPTNLAEMFQKDGLAVTATVRPRTDVMGIHMVGPVIEIIDIAVR
jgi:hypothetical protein